MTQLKGQMRGHRRLCMIMHRINGNICTREELENGNTHDDLWNAAQVCG